MISALALLRIALTLNFKKGCFGDVTLLMWWFRSSSEICPFELTTGGLGDMLSSLLWSD